MFIYYISYGKPVRHVGSELDFQFNLFSGRFEAHENKVNKSYKIKRE